MELVNYDVYCCFSIFLNEKEQTVLLLLNTELHEMFKQYLNRNYKKCRKEIDFNLIKLLQHIYQIHEVSKNTIISRKSEGGQSLTCSYFCEKSHWLSFHYNYNLLGTVDYALYVDNSEHIMFDNYSLGINMI